MGLIVASLRTVSKRPQSRSSPKLEEARAKGLGAVGNGSCLVEAGGVVCRSMAGLAGPGVPGRLWG
jgi:hypothetical protein